MSAYERGRQGGSFHAAACLRAGSRLQRCCPKDRDVVAVLLSPRR